MGGPHHRSAETPSECPVCGAAVPPGARACPECGADERAGWSEEATRYDGLDLPEAAFEDEADAARPRPGTRRRIGVLIAVTAVIAGLAFLWLTLR